MSKFKDTQSINYLLTINNPLKERPLPSPDEIKAMIKIGEGHPDGECHPDNEDDPDNKCHLDGEGSIGSEDCVDGQDNMDSESDTGDDDTNLNGNSSNVNAENVNAENINAATDAKATNTTNDSEATDATTDAKTTDATTDVKTKTIIYNHDTIKSIIKGMSNVSYFCFADEIGGEHNTYHAHVYIHFERRKKQRFSYIKRRFPHARIDKCKGNAQQNRAYVRKEGEKWENSKKKDTSVPGTFYEEGILPINEQGNRTDLDYIYGLIKEGHSDYEILSELPESMRYLGYIERTRQILVAQEMESKERDLTVIYVTGRTNTGKSYKLIKDHGASLFRSTNKRNPFDGFVPHKHVALAFEEFEEDIRLTDMLNYLDPYGLSLPARYSDRVATYEIVYIVSNRSLESLYPHDRTTNRHTYEAFISRIDKVRYHYLDRTYEEFLTQDYLDNRRYRECLEKDKIIYRSLTPKQKADRLKRRERKITLESTVDMSKYAGVPSSSAIVPASYTDMPHIPVDIPQIYDDTPRIPGGIPTIHDNTTPLLEAAFGTGRASPAANLYSNGEDDLDDL